MWGSGICSVVPPSSLTQLDLRFPLWVCVQKKLKSTTREVSRTDLGVSGNSEFGTREGAAEAQRMGSRPRHLPEEGKP